MLPYYLGDPIRNIDRNLEKVQYGNVLLGRFSFGGVDRTERGRRPRLLGGLRAAKMPALMEVFVENVVSVRRLWYTTFEGETKMFDGSRGGY